ncbi:MAG: metal-sulfur cluster assembly factor [Anaerolineales bacterium]|jgi:metal-sulfur cluster biosynthetic enzyme
MTEDQIRETLKQIYDPEIGVNIVDLGLVYNIEIKPEEVHIQLTMTSPACPLHGVITRNMDKILRQTFPELGPMIIELVWEPPWKPEMMSDAAKKQLGW